MRTLSRMYVSSGQSIFDSPSGVFSVTVNMHAAGARFTARAAGKAAGATRASALARNARAAANKTKKETVVKDRSRVVCRGEISRTGRGAGRHGRLRTDGFVQHLGSGEIDDGARRSHSAVVWSPCLRSFCRAQAQPGSRSPEEKRSYFPRPLLRAGVGAASAFFARLAGFAFLSGAPPFTAAFGHAASVYRTAGRSDRRRARASADAIAEALARSSEIF